MFEEYTILSQIGSGGFSTIYEGQKLTNDSTKGRSGRVAIKQISLSNLVTKGSYAHLEAARSDAFKEIKVMQKLQGHSNIVELVDVFQDVDSVCIV